MSSSMSVSRTSQAFEFLAFCLICEVVVKKTELFKSLVQSSNSKPEELETKIENKENIEEIATRFHMGGWFDNQRFDKISN